MCEGFFIIWSESSGSTTHSFLSLTTDTYTQTFWRFSANICVWMSWHPLYFYCIRNVCVMPWNIFTKEVSCDMFLIFYYHMIHSGKVVKWLLFPCNQSLWIVADDVDDFPLRLLFCSTVSWISFRISFLLEYFNPLLDGL